MRSTFAASPATGCNYRGAIAPLCLRSEGRLFRFAVANLLALLLCPVVQAQPPRTVPPPPAATRPQATPQPANAAQSSIPVPAAPPSRGGSAQLERMSGKWSGVVHSYPNLISIEMSLAPTAQGGLEGEATYKQLHEPTDRRFSNAALVPGSSKVVVQFDTRTDSFMLTLLPARGQAVYNQINLAGILGSVNGVLDERNAALAGRCGSGQDFYFFTRAERFSAIERTFEKFRGLDTPTGMRGLGSGGGGPSKSEMIRWMEPLAREYPNIDVIAKRSGGLEFYFLNLFEDRYFSSFFGSKYDELSISQLNGIASANRNGGRSTAEMYVMAVAYMFAPMVGTNRAKQTTLWVLALRTIRSWRDAQLQKLGGLEPSDQVFANIQNLSNKLTEISKNTLWPSDQAKNDELVLTSRRKMALPALDKKMHELEVAAPTRRTLLALDNWATDYSQMVAYIDDASRAALQKRADARIDAVLDDQMPAEMQRVKNLGTGLRAVEAGSQWYAHFKADYVRAMNRPAARAVFTAFQERRKDDFANVADEMMSQLRTPYSRIGAEVTTATEQARITYCKQLVDRLNQWFPVPGDTETAASRKVHDLAAELGAHARRRITPSKRPQTNLEVPQSARPSGKVGTDAERAEVSYRMVNRLLNADTDPDVRKLLPAPISDVGFELGTDICWDIFHGRFDEIRRGVDQRSNVGVGTVLTGAVNNANARFHYAFMAFVGISSSRYKQNQLGDTTMVWWELTRDGVPVERDMSEKKAVYISKLLVDYYASSYKIAEFAADGDALFSVFSLMRPEEMKKFVFEDGVLSRAGQRPDGTFNFVQAKWERPILADLYTLFDAWPDRSVAIWQFHENIRRYLNKLKSLQALYAENQTQNR